MRSSTDPLRLVGRIIKPHGVRGEVVVKTSLEALPSGESLITSRDGLILEVETARVHSGRLLVSFVGYGDRNVVETLRGLELFIQEDEEVLEEGWWEADLVGCSVVDRSGGELGVMSRVEPRDTQDLWVVDTQSGEVMVPAVSALVVEVDLEARKIVLDPPDGLF